MALSVLPLGSLWQWFVRIWPAAEFEAEFSGTEALATGGLLLLRQILRLVAKAAGIVAVMAECWPWLAAQDLPAPRAASGRGPVPRIWVQFWVFGPNCRT